MPPIGTRTREPPTRRGHARRTPPLGTLATVPTARPPVPWKTEAVFPKRQGGARPRRLAMTESAGRAGIEPATSCTKSIRRLAQCLPLGCQPSQGFCGSETTRVGTSGTRPCSASTERNNLPGEGEKGPGRCTGAFPVTQHPQTTRTLVAARAHRLARAQASGGQGRRGMCRLEGSGIGAASLHPGPLRVGDARAQAADRRANHQHRWQVNDLATRPCRGR